MKWVEIKKSGSNHYKTGELEMIDLYKSEGTLQDWAINEARHHMARNLSKLNTLGTHKCVNDMEKVIHYAEIIICLSEEAAEAENALDDDIPL
jgi:hypothetical protein